jgi:hypothetical protein
LYFTIPETSCAKGVVVNVNEHGGYKIGTKVGQIKGYMSRNQVNFFANPL